VRCSLIDEYVKKPSAHGMSTFNGSSVTLSNKSSNSCIIELGMEVTLRLEKMLIPSLPLPST
jgi:hypothetical protein